VLIRQLDAIRRLAPRLPDACRQALSDQADAILESASALVALDRRDLDAAWHRAHTALEALPRPSSGEQEHLRMAPRSPTTWRRQPFRDTRPVRASAQFAIESSPRPSLRL